MNEVLDRGEVERLARTMQVVTDDAVEHAWVDQGYTGACAANAAAKHGIALEVVQLPEVKETYLSGMSVSLFALPAVRSSLGAGS